MTMYRKKEVLKVILAFFNYLNKSPGQYVPVKTIQINAMNFGIIKSFEFRTVCNEGIEDGVFTYISGGVSGMGSLALTDVGYSRSRKLD
jgi:hypothetical protein